MILKQICPNCKNKVETLFSDWDKPINNGNLNVCEYCASDGVASKSKSLSELNNTNLCCLK